MVIVFLQEHAVLGSERSDSCYMRADVFYVFLGLRI